MVAVSLCLLTLPLLSKSASGFLLEGGFWGVLRDSARRRLASVASTLLISAVSEDQPSRAKKVLQRLPSSTLSRHCLEAVEHLRRSEGLRWRKICEVISGGRWTTGSRWSRGLRRSTMDAMEEVRSERREA